MSKHLEPSFTDSSMSMDNDDSESSSDDEVYYTNIKRNTIYKNTDFSKSTSQNEAKIRTHAASVKTERPKMYAIRLKNGKICSSKPINLRGEPKSSSSKENIRTVDRKIVPSTEKTNLANTPEMFNKIQYTPKNVTAAEDFNELSSLQKIRVRDVTDPDAFLKSSHPKPLAFRSFASSTFETESDDDSSHSNNDSLDIPNLNNIEIIDASESDEEVYPQSSIKGNEFPMLSIEKKLPKENENIIQAKRDTASKIIPSSQLLSRNISQVVSPSKTTPSSSQPIRNVVSSSKPAKTTVLSSKPIKTTVPSPKSAKTTFSSFKPATKAFENEKHLVSKQATDYKSVLPLITNRAIAAEYNSLVPLITNTPTIQKYNRAINKIAKTSTPISNTNIKITNVTSTSSSTDVVSKNVNSQMTKNVNIQPKPIFVPPGVSAPFSSAVLPSGSASLSSTVLPSASILQPPSIIVPPTNPTNFNIVVPKTDIIRCKQTNTPLILAIPSMVPLSSANPSSTPGSNLLMLLPHQLPDNLEPPGVVNFLVSNLQKKSGAAIQLPGNMTGTFPQTVTSTSTNSSLMGPQEKPTNILANVPISKNLPQNQSLVKSANTASSKDIANLQEDSSVDMGPKILNTKEKDGPNLCWYAPKFGKRDLEGFLYRDRLGFSKSDVSKTVRCLRKLNIAIYRKQEELDQIAAEIIRLKRGYKTTLTSKVKSRNKETNSVSSFEMRAGDSTGRNRDTSHKIRAAGIRKRGKDTALYKIRPASPNQGKTERPSELKQMIDSKNIKLIELPFLKKNSEEDDVTSTKSPQREQNDPLIDENESDLYFTKKVVILKNKMPLGRKLKKTGRLPKIRLRSSQNIQMESERQESAKEPLKYCKVVLERDEKIEEKIKETSESKVENLNDVRVSRKRKIDLEGMGLIKKVRRRNAIDSPLLSSKSKIEETAKAQNVGADMTYMNECVSDTNSTTTTGDFDKPIDLQNTTQKSTQTDYKKSVFTSYREYQKITKLSQTEITFIFTLNTIQSLQDLRLNENKPILLLDQFNYHFDFDTINNYNVLFTRDDDEPIPVPLLKNLELVYFVRCGFVKVVSRPVICKYILERYETNKGSEKQLEDLPAKNDRETKPKSSRVMKGEQKRNIDNFARHLSLRRKDSEKKKSLIFTKGVTQASQKSSHVLSKAKRKQSKPTSLKNKSSTPQAPRKKNVDNDVEVPNIEEKINVPTKSNLEVNSETLDEKFIEIEKNLSEMFEKPELSMDTSVETSIGNMTQNSTKSNIMSKPVSEKNISETTPSLEELFINSSDENTNLVSTMTNPKQYSNEQATGSGDSEMLNVPTENEPQKSSCGEAGTVVHETDNLIKLLVSAMDDSNSSKQASEIEIPDASHMEEKEVCDDLSKESCDYRSSEIDNISIVRNEKAVPVSNESENVPENKDNTDFTSESLVESPKDKSSSIINDFDTMDVEYSSEVNTSVADCFGTEGQESKEVACENTSHDNTEEFNVPNSQVSAELEEVMKEGNKSERETDSEMVEAEELLHPFENTSKVSEAEISVIEEGKPEGSDAEMSVMEEEGKQSNSEMSEPGIRKIDVKDKSEKQEDIVQSEESLESRDEVNISKEKFSTDLNVHEFLQKDSECTKSLEDDALDVDQFLNKNTEVFADTTATTNSDSYKSIAVLETNITDSELQSKDVLNEEAYAVTNVGSETIEASASPTKDICLMMEASDSSVLESELRVEPESSFNMDSISTEDILLETTESKESATDDSSKEHHVTSPTDDSPKQHHVTSPTDDMSSAEVFVDPDHQNITENTSEMELFEHASSDIREETDADVTPSNITFDNKADSSISNIPDLTTHPDTDEHLLSSCGIDADLAMHSDEISKDLPDDYLEK